MHIKTFSRAGLFLALLITIFCAFNATADEQTDLKRDIGQMFLVGFPGTRVNDQSFIAQAIRDLNLGGVVLYDFNVVKNRSPRNIRNPEQVKELIANLKSYSTEPLFVGIDAEGGHVLRLRPKYGFPYIPSHQELDGKNDLAVTTQVSSTLGQELRGLGFNVDFAPDVDVNVNPDNPIIGKLGRSFSQDPTEVYYQAKAFIEGLHDAGILSAIKHFPGEGSSNNDTHKGLVDITSTYHDTELIPFQRLIKDDEVDMVMTAHIINGNVDPNYPVTLSDHYIKDVLRGRLNFQGVVVSDGMQMKAITDNYGFKEAIIRAVNAGCDILLFSNNEIGANEKDIYKARDIIYDAVQSGEIPMSRITESLERIKKLKDALLSDANS